MKNFLREAFALACKAPTYINDAYDHAGFTVWRALIDKDFLRIDEQNIQSPFLRKMAGYYEDAKGRGQEALLENISNKGAAGDFYPKPDFKPGLYSLANMSFAGFSKLTPISGLALAASIAVAWGMSSYQTSGGGFHGVDIIGTWLGANGGKSSSPRP